jgi:hypothetical protein
MLNNEKTICNQQCTYRPCLAVGVAGGHFTWIGYDGSAMFNPTEQTHTTQVSIPSLGVCDTVQLPAFRLQTYVVRCGKLDATEPI